VISKRLELAGESVRAVVEALAVAAPGWLPTVIDVHDWTQRYGARVDSWRLPTSAVKRTQLARLMAAMPSRCCARCMPRRRRTGWPSCPRWRSCGGCWWENYHIRTDTRGREVITRREADTDGLPPDTLRISSPYDTNTRWAAKGEDLAWNGYKVHLSETCHTNDPDTASPCDDADTGQRDAPAKPASEELPHLITNVASTDATIPDVAMTTPIHRMLDRRGLLPGQHYLDSGYPSAELMTRSRTEFGIELITPLHGDQSPQARAGTGVDPKATCGPCPVREQCTTSRARRRQLTVHPREVHTAQRQARAIQDTKPWQATYALRAGVEGTIHQAVAVCDIRHARYRNLRKVHLQQVFSAVALNLIRSTPTGTPTHGPDPHQPPEPTRTRPRSVIKN
jgi:hypothetical protein